MDTIIINAEKEVPPPAGNPFTIIAHDAFTMMEGVNLVDTGIDIELPPKMTLDIRPSPEVMILSWSNDYRLPSGLWQHSIKKGRLVILCAGEIEKKSKIGDVYVVERQIARVRYMQRGVNGGRLIRGDMQVANSP